MSTVTDPLEVGTNRAAIQSTASKQLPNAAPLGLSAFALTTFLLGLFNLSTRGISAPNLVIGPAFAYGGLVQLLAGMWEMAIGNTLTATALSSFGAFWISVAIIFTPGGFEVIDSLGGAESEQFYNAFGLFLMSWFIFTTLIVLANVRTTLASFLLFFALDLAFLLLGIAYLVRPGGKPNAGLLKAGGVFCVLAAFLPRSWLGTMLLLGFWTSPTASFVFPLVLSHGLSKLEDSSLSKLKDHARLRSKISVGRHT